MPRSTRQNRKAKETAEEDTKTPVKTPARRSQRSSSVSQSESDAAVETTPATKRGRRGTASSSSRGRNRSSSSTKPETKTDEKEEKEDITVEEEKAPASRPEAKRNTAPKSRSSSRAKAEPVESQPAESSTTASIKRKSRKQSQSGDELSAAEMKESPVAARDSSKRLKISDVESGKETAQVPMEIVETPGENDFTEKCKKLWIDEFKWDPVEVASMYTEFLLRDDPERLKKIMFLEFHQYLERYLLPNFDGKRSSSEHIMSMVTMVNEKCRAKVPCWDCFSEESFAAFFHSVLKLSISKQLHLSEKRAVVAFFVHVFANIETDMVRKECMRLVNISIWNCLLESRRINECEKYGQLKKIWRHYEKKYNQAGPDEKQQMEMERTWLSEMIKDFISTIGSQMNSKNLDNNVISYSERFLELIIDLETQLPTRRYVNSLIDDHQLITLTKKSVLAQTATIATKVFRELLEMASFYAQFDMDEHTGQAFSDTESTKRHYERMITVQKLFFSNEDTKELMDEFCMADIKSLETPETLKYHLAKLSIDQLQWLFQQLHFRDKDLNTGMDHSKDCLISFLVDKFSARSNLIEKLSMLPIFPNENEFWDRTLLSTEKWNGQHCIALPKMNLQFLTMHDYLLRNYQLYRLESTYQIRQDIEDSIMRLAPKASTSSESRNWTSFSGWSRMALPIETFEIVNIGKPNVGESRPSSVRASISYSLAHYPEKIAEEWDTIRKNDVLFLVSIKAPIRQSGEKWLGGETGIDQNGRTFQEYFGVQCVRGCEVIDFRDEEGELLVDKRTGRPLIEGERIRTIGARRYLQVTLDTNQFHLDAQNSALAQSRGEQHTDPYQTFNILLRRQSKENNFKSVIETIRDLLVSPTHVVVPDWLHNIFLGYGDPSSAHYSKMVHREEELLSAELKAAGSDTRLTEAQRDALRTIDFHDTFLDWDHLESSFSGSQLVEIQLSEEEEERAMAVKEIRRKQGLLSQDQLMTDSEHVQPPFVIKFDKKSTKSSDQKTKSNATEGQDVLHISNRHHNYEGPIAEIRPRHNHIRFTPKQIEAIRAGTSPGLTLIVGPPGTGKTDVAVQILSNIYHNNPDQHTLIITHSNQALNQLFEKMVNLNINERHLLRLGHGTDELEGNQNWSKYGRVSSFLERRTELLQDVRRLCASMKLVAGDVDASCETATKFYSFHICSHWYEFIQKWENIYHSTRKTMKPAEDRAKAVELVKEFPFLSFFVSAPAVLEKQIQVFPANITLAEALEIAKGCWIHLTRIFDELKEMRAFELLSNNYDRSNYLLTKGAKIIAMTCTHAAIKRSELISLGFRYDNVIMEEAAQVLEIETFVPLLLQNTSSTGGMSRLKRVVLIGDHNQLPPVVQNAAFQKYCNMEQSLFKRLVRLGVPTVELDAQGRCRSSLRELFSWHYRTLTDLPNVLNLPEFQFMNAGFLYEYQFINVADFGGRGESEPVPHFIQNLGEAEYVVAVYQYMRLLGYPAEKITILTTYNGQRALINDVLKQRCSWNPMFGYPAKIATVDKYQGQQNDYILLSLVRTKTVGHLRDVRRLIVAMSRARLGLYVFGRQSIFASYHELEPVFGRLTARPTQLQLLPTEKYSSAVNSDFVLGTSRKVDGPVVSKNVRTIQGVEDMGAFVYETCQKMEQIGQ